MSQVWGTHGATGEASASPRHFRSGKWLEWLPAALADELECLIRLDCSAGVKGPIRAGPAAMASVGTAAETKAARVARNVPIEEKKDERESRLSS